MKHYINLNTLLGRCRGIPEQTVERQGSSVFCVCKSSEAERERLKPLERNERVCEGWSDAHDDSNDKSGIKSAVRIIFVILIIAVVMGCGKKQAGIEGKIVDGMGQPMSGTKVTAKQFWPVKGYEQFETTTDSDGIFRFKGLFPSSDYSIFPWSDEWKTSEKVMVKTGLEGKTSKLSLPITVRFTLSNDGIITDSQLRLQWAPAPDQPMDWFQANKYAQNLSLGGGGWRLPSRSELKSVYNISMKGGADLFFRINENWVWTSETQGDSAWFCSFIYGREGTTFRKYLGSHGRVLAVRSLK